MNTKWIAVFAAALPLTALAQINYSGGLYTQDFDTLQSGVIYTPYSNLPAGWTIGSTYNSGSYVWTTVTNGFSDNYGKYCFSSTAGDPDKSVGLVIGSTGPASLGAQFRNTSGVTLTAFSLRFFVEQWSKGTVLSNDQKIPFSFSLDATSLTSGTYASVSALDLHSVHDGDGVAGAMNGNVSSNRQFVSATVSDLSWAPNQDLWIRWSGVASSFSTAHALAVDDVGFRATPELRVASVGPKVRASWSASYPGYRLESAATVSAMTWDVVTNVSAIVGGEFSVEVQPTGAPQFFRLKSQ